MKEITGSVFSIFNDNQPIPGCTISKEIWASGGSYLCCFSLAEWTDISAEIYSYYKLLIVLGGKLEVYAPKQNTAWTLSEGDCILTPTDTPIGMRTIKGTVYTELSIGRMDSMNNVVDAGTVFKLSDLVPYQEGKIVNMDVAHNEKMKFVVMAFDEGTGLAEHAAPGEALIFALDGQGVIGYEGEAHTIRAGENFKFAAGGKHWVKADGKFKMALLLTLE